MLQTSSTTSAMQLLAMTQGLIIHQALYSAAKLGVADLLKDGPQACSDLARTLKVNESALYRILRLLASQSVFEEKVPRTFVNTELSQFLCTGLPGSVRSILIFRGSEFFFSPFAEILYSIETGRSARAKVLGMDGFEYLRTHPEMARIFDDAMTNMSELIGGAVAAAYDFGRWRSLMDVGGGNGILLAPFLGHILDCAASWLTCRMCSTGHSSVTSSAVNSNRELRWSLVISSGRCLLAVKPTS
jgi:hypothetical protein